MMQSAIFIGKEDPRVKSHHGKKPMTGPSYVGPVCSALSLNTGVITNPQTIHFTGGTAFEVNNPYAGTSELS